MSRPIDQNSLPVVVRGGRCTAVAPPSTAGPPLGDILGNSIVPITAGKGQFAKTFHIHTNLLCQKVKFFDAMFNGEFIEGRTQASTLPEDHPVAFKLFVGWLYKGIVEVPNAGKGRFVSEELELFGFAEKYDIIELADKTMDHLVGRMKFAKLLFSVDQMSLAYKLTHAASKLRLFTARSAAYAVLRFRSDQANHAWCKANMQRAITQNPDLGGDALETMRPRFNREVEDPRDCLLCDYY